MKRGDVIQGYRILEDFRVAGGMSKVTFAERDGKEYFIKEFLDPKYPMPGSAGSERTKAQKRKACENFENRHRRINNLIKERCSGLGGGLVYAVAFFRHGASYYKVNEKIDTSSLSLTEISNLPLVKIITIARSVCQSVSILHDAKIVHGDLKPDNILIKETSLGTFSGKLIDFDDSYFSEQPPTIRDSIVGTPEYYSPELAAYIKDEDEVIEGKTLSLASDVFTLGIIFCEYFTGEKPVTGSTPTWYAVANGKSISFAKPLNREIEILLRSMLSLRVEDRPNVKKVLNSLREIKEGLTIKSTKDRLRPGLIGRVLKKTKPTSVTPSSPRVGLRGKGLKNADK